MNGIFPQTSRGSFSAVSTPIFASKLSLESSRRDLHNALLRTVLQSQNFSQKSSIFFSRLNIEFPFFRRILHSKFLRIFDEFFPRRFLSGFRDKFQKRVTCVACSIKFAKTNQKVAENFEICEKLFTIIQNYSLVSLIVVREAYGTRHRQRCCGRRCGCPHGITLFLAIACPTWASVVNDDLDRK